MSVTGLGSSIDVWRVLPVTRVMAVVAGLADRILSLHGSVALALVFTLPALEASAFLGFVFPGEIAVLLGGVLAFQGRISLPAAIAAAVSGAIVGDTVGYFIGRRWGHSIIHGTLGRLPFIRRHLGRSLDRAKAYLGRRGGRAIFVGRFTTALRVLVPGLAGMSGMPYGRFFAANALGALVWGAGFVLLGYAAGETWRRAESVAGIAGIILLGLVVLGLTAVWIFRRWSDRSSRIRLEIERLAHVPPLSWVRRRFPTQVVWLRARLDPGTARGFPLTFAAAAAGLSVWAFAALTQDVLRNEEAVRLDPGAERWLLAHRVAWLTHVMRGVTWLGSSAVVVPVVVVVAAVVVLRDGRWRWALGLLSVLAGAIVLSHLTKVAVGRPRPPEAVRLVATTGSSFPSGHAVYALAAWTMVALVLSVRRPFRIRAALWGAAAAIALVVGASRLYLGAHWLTDVLAGYAAGGMLVAGAGAVLLAVGPAGDRTERGRAVVEPGPIETGETSGVTTGEPTVGASPDARIALT